MTMPVSPQKKLAILKRRQQVAELYLQSWPQAAIAEQLSVEQSTISADLKAIRKEWRESAIRDFDEAQAEELKKLDRVEREAYAAWEQSKKPSQSAVINGESGTQPSRKNVRTQYGDPRLLEIVLKCIAQRREILGLDAHPSTQDFNPHASIPLEQRHARILTVLTTLGERERIAAAGRGPSAAVAGDVCPGDEPGKMAPGTPPELS
jgi:hypothetical protein